jgi:LacI family transcriptional regulator
MFWKYGMNNPGQPKITTKDLARICKVSLGTIDRAFHDKAGISRETKRTILETAEKLGYRPNHIGRSLQSGKTHEIGVVVHDLDNRFFSQLVNAIQQVAWENGYYIQLAVSLRDCKRESHILEHMVQRNVDGILLFPTNKGEEFSLFLRDLGKPLVLLANKIKEPSGISWPFVGLNNREVVHEVIEKIAAAGYAPICFVAPYFDSEEHNYYEIEERYRAFLDVVRRRKIPYRTFLNQNYLIDIASMNLEGRPAFFCVSDIFALELYNHFNSRGIAIPDDAGIMGFDDIDVLKYIRPGLNTVRYPVTEMGTAAFHILKMLILGKKIPEEQTLRADIVWRNSIQEFVLPPFQ